MRWKSVAIIGAPILAASASWAAWAAVGNESHDTYHGLISEARTGLQLCIEDPNGSLVGKGVGLTEAGLDRIPDAEWQRGEFGGQPSVAESCPTGPQLYSPAREDTSNVRVVDQPSRFHGFIYIDPAVAEVSKRGWRTTAAELQCAGDQCAEVTTALWIAPAAMADPLQIRRGIEAASWYRTC